jgi:cold shock CspA family protein
MRGTVKHTNTEKHFGFILTEAGDFFYRFDSVIGDMPDLCAEVDFWLADDPMRLSLYVATEVRLVEQPWPMRGRCVALCPERNFGLIRMDGRRDNVFFQTACVRGETFAVNDEVEFAATENPRRPGTLRAAWVARAGSRAPLRETETA